MAADSPSADRWMNPSFPWRTREPRKLCLTRAKAHAEVTIVAPLAIAMRNLGDRKMWTATMCVPRRSSVLIETESTIIVIVAAFLILPAGIAPNHHA